MEKKDFIIRCFKKKIKELKNHNNFYYNFDNPKISDAEYDKLKTEIFELEKNNKFLKDLKLLDKIVGAKPPISLKK